MVVCSLIKSTHDETPPFSKINYLNWKMQSCFITINVECFSLSCFQGNEFICFYSPLLFHRSVSRPALRLLPRRRISWVQCWSPIFLHGETLRGFEGTAGFWQISQKAIICATVLASSRSNHHIAHLMDANDASYVKARTKSQSQSE